jgi:hypothetical protein
MEDNNNEKSLEEGLFIPDKLSRARKYVQIRGWYGPIFYFFAVIPPPSCWLYVSISIEIHTHKVVTDKPKDDIHDAARSSKLRKEIYAFQKRVPSSVSDYRLRLATCCLGNLVYV